MPYVASPDNDLLPPGSAPDLGRSNGLEGMAISTDRRTLYPVLEAPLTGDCDQLRRWVFEYDVPRGRFTGRRWQYRVEQPGNLVADFTTLDRDRLLGVERDNGEGAAAAFKRIFVVDLDRTDAEGRLVKRQVVDLLAIRDPTRLSLPGPLGDIGSATRSRCPT